MSFRLMMAVWDSDLKAALRPTALVLARFANDDGERIYPAIDRVAWLTKKTERQVQRDIGELMAMGVLVAITPRTGGRFRTTRYRLEVAALPSRHPFDSGNPDTGVTLSERNPDTGVTLSAEKPRHLCHPFETDVAKPRHLCRERATSMTGKGDMGVTRSVSEVLEKVQEGRTCDSNGGADSQSLSSADNGRGLAPPRGQMSNVGAVARELAGGEVEPAELLERVRARLMTTHDASTTANGRRRAAGV